MQARRWTGLGSPGGSDPPQPTEPMTDVRSAAGDPPWRFRSRRPAGGTGRAGRAGSFHADAIVHASIDPDVGAIDQLLHTRMKRAVDVLILQLRLHFLERAGSQRLDRNTVHDRQ